MKKHFLGFTMLLLCVFGNNARAQDTLLRCSPLEYISKYKDAAVADMKLYGVPASITLAQGLFESDCGNSLLAKEANNHFGIKCHKGWTGETFIQDDETENECFRKYKTVQASFDDHSAFLRTRERYSDLFKLSVTDYKGWALGLKRAGYATNPNYAERLIKLIETYQLYAFDGGTTIAGQTINAPVTNQNNTQMNMTVLPVVTEGAQAVFNHNNIEATRVQRGDTWYKLARQHNLELAQLLQYNDATPNEILHADEIIYLAPKHRHADEDIHQVRRGDTFRSISQLYGIRLKRLLRLNAKANPILAEGALIKLR